MIKIAIIHKDGGIKGVECSGHSGYAAQGKDIVCSAVSAIVQTALLGLMDISEVEYERREGFLSFTCPEATDENGIKQQAILRAMYLGLKDMQSGYKAFINMEER